MKDQTFLEKIIGLKTIEEVQSAFKERDVDVSIEELENLKKLILKLKDSNGELTEEELEKYFGGAGAGTVAAAATFGMLIGMIVQPILQAITMKTMNNWLASKK